MVPQRLYLPPGRDVISETRPLEQRGISLNSEKGLRAQAFHCRPVNVIISQRVDFCCLWCFPSSSKGSLPQKVNQELTWKICAGKYWDAKSLRTVVTLAGRGPAYPVPTPMPPCTHPSSSTMGGGEDTVGRKEAMQLCHDLLTSPGATGDLKWRSTVTTEVESLYWHLCL